MTAWRLALVDFGGHPPDETARARDLGPPDRVRNLIDAAIAEVVWRGTRGVLQDGDVTLELDLGDADPVARVDVRVDGVHPRRLRPLVVHLCRVNGWAARDEDTGRYLDLDADLDESLD